ncbi:MAG: pSer/pThr/pTyr-binding forkhead associated (FHA) protein [Planctomycetota bacterium]|jgi:pSer/pThr/pTyr-binding forkhead associated (FHA) protein
MSELAFRISEPGHPTKEVPIKVGVSLGRLDENTVTIIDSKISGRHAHVVEKDGKLVIEDLGSSNHTHILGGSSLKGGESHPLTVGTMVQIGETKLVVVAIGGQANSDKTVAAQMITLDGGDNEEGGAASNLATLAAFKASRARIVIADDAIRTIGDIDKIEYFIGRAGETTSLAIENKAVSTNHAVIRFEKKQFTIEDLSSSNGTFIDGERLEPNQKKKLSPETHVRFGSINALFVVDSDADGITIDPKRFRNAVEVLIVEGTLPASQRDDAIRDAQAEGRHPGEILLQKGLISVEDWLRAYKKAEFFVATGHSGGGSGSGGGNKNLMIAVIALLVVLIILLIVN